MKLNRFCAKCGDKFKENDQIYKNFLCEKCFKQIATPYVLPEEIQLRKCIHCSAFSLRYNDQDYEWRYRPEDENFIDFLSRILYEDIFFHLERKQEIIYEFFFPTTLNQYQHKDIDLKVEVQGKQSENYNEGTMLIKVREIHCPHCARRKGGRFNAIVQIRIQHERDLSRLDEIMQDVTEIEKKANMGNLHYFITSIEKTVNGYDLKVSENAMARVLEHKLKIKYPFEVKYSKRLMGINQEDGSKQYRQSTLLRLVPVQSTDNIKLDGHDYFVEKITRKRIILRDLHSDEIQHKNFDIFQKKPWFFLEKESD